MVAITSGHQLPYPTGPDAPCDSWQTWKAFATLLDSKLTAINTDLDRTTRARPMAKVSSHTPQVMGIIAGARVEVAFDAVEVDTDSMVDLNKSPTVITVRRSGIYMLEAWVDIPWQPLVDNALLDFDIVEGGNNIEDGGQRFIKRLATELAEAAAYPITMYARGFTRCNNAETDPRTFGLEAFSFGPAGPDATVNAAELSVVWMADL